MNRRILFLLFLTILPLFLLGQNKPRKVFQFSGIVVSETTNEPIPYVRVQVNHTRQGTYSNSQGFYSIPVGLGDTLYFTRLGYYRSKLIVLDYVEQYQGDKSFSIYAVNYMLEDTLSLPMVNIFPYDTPEEIRTAVVNMEVLHDSPTEYALQNMDPETMHSIMQNLSVDGSERLAISRQMYYDYYRTKDIMPTASLDPIAITRLLTQVANTKKKKRDKNLNYWRD